MRDSDPRLTPGTPGRREFYSVTITSTRRSGVTQFRISRTLAGLAAWAGILLVVVNVAGLIVLGHLLQRARASGELLEDNHNLRGQLAQLVAMEQRLAALDSMRVAVLRAVGVEETERPPASEVSLDGGSDDPAAAYRLAGPGPDPVWEDLEVIRATLTRMPMAGPRTRGFGPLGDDGIFHTGNDIAGQTGAAIMAAGDGIVSFVGADKVFGNVLVVAHGPRLSTMYGHASRILVGVGDFVSAGEVVARAGSTGRSTAPHLHFEIQWDGKSIDPSLVFSRWQGSVGPDQVEGRPGGSTGPGGGTGERIPTTHNLGSR